MDLLSLAQLIGFKPVSQEKLTHMQYAARPIADGFSRT